MVQGTCGLVEKGPRFRKLRDELIRQVSTVQGEAGLVAGDVIVEISRTTCSRGAWSNARRRRPRPEAAVAADASPLAASAAACRDIASVSAAGRAATPMSPNTRRLTRRAARVRCDGSLAAWPPSATLLRPHENTWFGGVISTMTSPRPSPASPLYCGYLAYSSSRACEARALLDQPGGPLNHDSFRLDQASRVEVDGDRARGLARRFRILRALPPEAKQIFPPTSTVADRNDVRHAVLRSGRQRGRHARARDLGRDFSVGMLAVLRRCKARSITTAHFRRRLRADRASPDVRRDDGERDNGASDGSSAASPEGGEMRSSTQHEIRPLRRAATARVAVKHDEFVADRVRALHSGRDLDAHRGSRRSSTGRCAPKAAAQRSPRAPPGLWRGGQRRRTVIRIVVRRTAADRAAVAIASSTWPATARRTPDGARSREWPEARQQEVMFSAKECGSAFRSSPSVAARSEPAVGPLRLESARRGSDGSEHGGDTRLAPSPRQSRRRAAERSEQRSGAPGRAPPGGGTGPLVD